MTNTCIRKSSEISPECTRENACSPEAFKTDILKSTAETSSECCMQIWIHVAWNELGSAESAFRQGHWLGNFLRFLPTTSKKDKFKSMQVPGKVMRWQKMGRSLCFHWKHWLLRPPPQKKKKSLWDCCSLARLVANPALVMLEAQKRLVLALTFSIYFCNSLNWTKNNIGYSFPYSLEPGFCTSLSHLFVLLIQGKISWGQHSNKKQTAEEAEHHRGRRLPQHHRANQGTLDIPAGRPIPKEQYTQWWLWLEMRTCRPQG